MLSPYVLDYAARISVILLPWAALPWLIGLAMRAGRQGGWRWPAWFALVIALVGGVNATALLFAGIGPGAVVRLRGVGRARDRGAPRARRRRPHRRCSRSACRCGGSPACGPRARYGIPILRYTETYETVAKVSNAPEVLRGLGYWFFYGDDKLGPWIEPSVAYTQHLWLIGAGYLLGDRRRCSPPARCGGSDRGYFVALLAIGTLIAVGSHPYDDPSPVRVAVRPVHPPRPRARAALDAARGAADHPLARGDARRRACGARAVASTGRARRRDGRGRRRGHQPAAALHRPDGGRTTCSAPRSIPTYWQRGRRTTSTPRATTPACSSSPAPTSRRTGGATRSTRSCPA